MALLGELKKRPIVTVGRELYKTSQSVPRKIRGSLKQKQDLTITVERAVEELCPKEEFDYCQMKDRLKNHPRER